MSDQGVSTLLTQEQEKKKNKIRKALISELKKQNLYVEPFADMVDRYMAMWETCLFLERDIYERGVQIKTEKTGWKKNDSVALLTTTNKQMLILLEKLSVSTSKIKADDGADI